MSNNDNPNVQGVGALDRVPVQLNQLSQLNFKLVIKRMPVVNYFCTKVNVPGAILPVVWQPTPMVPIPQFGDQLEYKPLVAYFKVDEDLRNYFEMYNWLTALGGANDRLDYAALKANPDYTGKGVFSEAVLTILNSARKVNLVVNFHGCVPVEISDLQFNSQDHEVQTLNAMMVIRYSHFDYEIVAGQA